MSKPFMNPFFEADMSKMFDMSKMMGGMDMAKMFDMSKMMNMADTMKMFDMSKMMGGMDMAKMFDMSKMMNMADMSKMMGEAKMPLLDMDAMMALQRKNMEAIVAMSQASYESMMALWRRQADSYRQAVEEMMEAVQSIMSSPTPEAKAMKQAEVSKAAMDKYIANLRDASETFAKCNSQAMETVGMRMNESLSEMCGMVKNVADRAA